MKCLSVAGAYTMKEIGVFFGVHYMTVSRAVKKSPGLKLQGWCLKCWIVRPFLVIIVDAITNMPWVSAKSQFPLGCLVLARKGIIESDVNFKARTQRELELNL